MSFILDALRRTDRDRKSGINPNLESVVELAPKAPARHRSHWLAAAGIVALGAGAALLLWPQSSQQTPQPVMAAARPAPSVPPGSTPIASPPRPAPPPARPNEMVRAPRRTDPAPTAASRAAPEATRTQGPTGVPMDGSLSAAVQRRQQGQVRPTQGGALHRDADNLPVPTALDTEDQTAVALPAPPAGQSVSRPPAATEIVPGPETATELETETAELLQSVDEALEVLETPDLSAAEPVVVAPVAAETPPLPTEGPLAEVPLAESLAPNQRQLFDGIRLDAHVYADDPSKRFVLIHMRGHRVGDTVGSGDTVIEAITSEGAVMRSGSVRALIPHP